MRMMCSANMSIADAKCCYHDKSDEVYMTFYSPNDRYELIVADRVEMS